LPVSRSSIAERSERSPYADDIHEILQATLSTQ
jgi:hypothetical protein